MVSWGDEENTGRGGRCDDNYEGSKKRYPKSFMATLRQNLTVRTAAAVPGRGGDSSIGGGGGAAGAAGSSSKHKLSPASAAGGGGGGGTFGGTSIGGEGGTGIIASSRKNATTLQRSGGFALKQQQQQQQPVGAGGNSASSRTTSFEIYSIRDKSDATAKRKFRVTVPVHFMYYFMAVFLVLPVMLALRRQVRMMFAGSGGRNGLVSNGLDETALPGNVPVSNHMKEWKTHHEKYPEWIKEQKKARRKKEPAAAGMEAPTKNQTATATTAAGETENTNTNTLMKQDAGKASSTITTSNINSEGADAAAEKLQKTQGEDAMQQSSILKSPSSDSASSNVTTALAAANDPSSPLLASSIDTSQQQGPAGDKSQSNIMIPEPATTTNATAVTQVAESSLTEIANNNNSGTGRDASQHVTTEGGESGSDTGNIQQQTRRSRRYLRES